MTQLPMGQPGHMGPGYGAFWFFAVVWWAIGLIAVVIVVLSLWRGMRAQESMAQHLAAIERLLTERLHS